MAVKENVTDRSTISSIETFFDKLLRGKLTNNLYFDSLPTVLKKDWKNLAVVDCHNVMRDHDAYSKGTVLVILYAKQNAYGLKDVKTMQEMELTLNRLIKENNNEYYHTSIRGNYGNYDAVNDIYYDIVQINLIIT